MYYPPLPYPQSIGYRDPNIAPHPWAPATGQDWKDTHSPPTLNPAPYLPGTGTFTAQQWYGYTCDICMANDAPNMFAVLRGPMAIVRTVTTTADTATYTITKSGLTATKTYP